MTQQQHQQIYKKINPSELCAYVDAGFTLAPLVGYTKIPARKGFLNNQFDPEFVPEERNYAVLLRNRYLVIDCDPRNYEKEDKPLTRLLNELNLPPDIFKKTFVVKTPRGGYHIYFKKHPDTELVVSLKEFPGIEFKTKFIMACGSYIHKSRDGQPIFKSYTRIYGSPSSIMQAPQILIARLLRPAPKELELNTTVLPDNTVDIKAFIQYCQTVEPAIEGKNGDLRTYQVACNGRDRGLSEQKTYEILSDYFNPRCVPTWPQEDLIAKVKNAYTYSTRSPAGVMSVQNQFEKVEDDKPKTIEVKYQMDHKGNIKKCLFNLQMFFEYPTLQTDKNTNQTTSLNIPPIGNYLRYNEFSHQIEWFKPAPWHKSGREWSDEDAILFRSLLSEKVAMDFNKNDIHDTAVVCSHKRSYHPVRDYLNGCEWDGIYRLDNWLARYCGVLDSDYSRFIGRKTLVAAIARIFKPGIKFDHVLVMEGVQGIGKSYMWDVLASPWFTDAPLNIQDKGAVEVMQGKWIVELSEMVMLSKYESRIIKGFLTRTEDRCRMAFERKAKSFPRQNIFVGSMNNDQMGWLKDHTGNRRYWPVAVSRIDIDGLQRDRDALWAEAKQAFDKGEALFVFDPRMQRQMQSEVDSRMQEDPWFALIETYLYENTAEFVANNRIEVVPVDLYRRCVGGSLTSFDTKSAARITAILKLLGFEKIKSPDRLGYLYIKNYETEL